MAKKKQDEVVIEESSDIKSIAKKHTKGKEKIYGEIIKTGSELLNQRRGQKLLTVSPVIDIALGGGVREGTWMLVSGAPKCGKAQPTDETVYTPNGPVEIGSIKVGDRVCGFNGPVNVLGVYPQGFKDVYEVVFTDGTSARCCDEHLWTVKPNYPNGEFRTMPLKEFRKDLSLSDRNKWQVAIATAYFNQSDLTIDPYILGIIISYGRFEENNIKFKSLPQHLVPLIANFAGIHGYILSNNTFVPTEDSHESLISDIQYLLGRIGSRTRGIADKYKYSSFKDRMDLIRGIFTRGAYRHRDGYIEYDTKNENLINDVAEVLRSLGYYCKKSVRKTEYRLVINTKNSSELLSKSNSYAVTSKTLKDISHVKFVGRSPCVCIEVDAKDGLYLTNDFIVTHNTTTAMQICANAQKEGRKVIWINSEGRLSEMNFDVPDLDPEKMIVVGPDKAPMSAEDLLDITIQLISDPEFEGAVCVIDSISSLIPQKEIDEEVTGSMRPGLPKILSNFCKKAGHFVPNNKILMICITHMITNTSGYGASRMADGGVKIQYQADTRMEVSSISPWMSGDKQIGQSVNWKIHCSSLGAKSECTSWINYGHGIDNVQEVLMLAEELGFIIAKGSWFELRYLEEPLKLQGRPSVYEHLKEHPQEVEQLIALIKEGLE